MAKGASTEVAMGKLHDRLTAIFSRVLKKYEDNLEAMSADTLEDGMVTALFDEGMMPSPAMLSVIAKFLKDNDITIESEELDQLSEMEERLAAKKRARPSMKTVTDVPLIN